MFKEIPANSFDSSSNHNKPENNLDMISVKPFGLVSNSDNSAAQSRGNEPNIDDMSHINSIDYLLQSVDSETQPHPYTKKINEIIAEQEEERL